MNDDTPMNPKKAILAVMVTGLIIVASVATVFAAADYAGMITAEVSVYGSAPTSNATACYLYVDGVKVDTDYFDYYDYSYIYDRYFSFYDVRVKANVEHEFQVITSDGEESNLITEYTPYGEYTYISLSIVNPEVSLKVQGSYKGNVSCNRISFYLDSEYISQYYVTYPGYTDYLFTTTVYENSYHTILLRAYDYYTQVGTNQTAVYIGSESLTFQMDLDA